MNNQKELLAADAVEVWRLSQAIDLRTMIYTQPEAEGLADAAVETAEQTAKAEKEPLSEEEKARLWRAVMESCSG